MSFLFRVGMNSKSISSPYKFRSPLGVLVYILVEKVRICCLPMEAFWLHGDLNDWTINCYNMLVKRLKETTINKT